MNGQGLSAQCMGEWARRHAEKYRTAVADYEQRDIPCGIEG